MRKINKSFWNRIVQGFHTNYSISNIHQSINSPHQQSDSERSSTLNRPLEETGR